MKKQIKKKEPAKVKTKEVKHKKAVPVKKKDAPQRVKKTVTYPLEPLPLADQQPKINEGVIVDMRVKYPQLTDNDFVGTDEEMAARIAAKIGGSYSDFVNILKGRQHL